MNKKMKRTKSMSSWALCAVGFVALSACNQNPIPLDQRMRPTTVEAPSGPQDVDSIYGFSFNDRQQVTVKEGERVEFGFQVNVEPPGQPIVEIGATLPPGMTFDQTELKLIWTPGFEAGNDVNAGALPNTFRDYEVPLRLRSTATGPSARLRTVVFHVVDVRRPISMSFDQVDPMVTEGETFSQLITVDSADFPRGPFTLTATGLPDNARFSEVIGTPNQFQMAFDTLPWDCTKNKARRTKDGQQACEYTVTYTATANQLTFVTKTQKLLIVDQRKAPIVTGVESVEMAPDISFSLASVDPNYESAPDMQAWAPPYGKIVINTGREKFTIDNKKKVTRQRLAPNDTLPELQAVASVQWLGIPTDKIGSEEVLTFESCVNRDDYPSYWQVCGTYPVKVMIGAPRFKAPTIERSDWSFGSLQYVKEGEQLRVAVYPRAADDSGEPLVQIESATDASEVTYDSASNAILIDAKSPGMKSFKLVATSPLSGTIRAEEAFTYEVLPKGWSPVLMLVDGTRDAESQKATQLFDSVQLLNPWLQALDERALSRRDTLVIGTSVLTDPEMVAKVEALSAKFTNVVIMSPLLDAFKGEIAVEWKTLGIALRRRLGSDPSIADPKVDGFEVVKDVNSSAPGNPTGTVVLAGRATSASASPMLLREAPAKNCSLLMKYELKGGGLSHPGAYSCNRSVRGKKGPGRMLVSGFEWADLVLASDDQGLLKQWMSHALNP